MAGLITYSVEDKIIIDQIKSDAHNVALELFEVAKLKRGQIVVVGCSTSETLGEKIGSYSVPEVGEIIYKAIDDVYAERGIYIAGQCCEHLNRAIIVEKSAFPNIEEVNVIPQPKAGGSFATACYKYMKNPIAIEEIQADAGIDIGSTLIGMHLKRVAVPVKLESNHVGKAFVTAARVRPKYIGGQRAIYRDDF